MTQKIPTGTRIYITKKGCPQLCIQPDKTLVNDNLYVAYDVKINGRIVIPKGTRVIGDWVTESSPLSAQLQITRIFLHGSGQPISADSDILDAVTAYNNCEVDNTGYLHGLKYYRSMSNITRRITKFHCRVKTLLDNNINTIYLEIDTKEIPVTLMEDFTATSC